nr:uncharacterized protein LOC119162178 [Rhipicephalus microplus]
MDHLRPPEPLRLTADGGRNWMRFCQQFEFFLQATAYQANPRSKAAKTALLLSGAGEGALDVFNNFVFSGEENKEDFCTVIAKFEDYCLEQQNEIHDRAIRVPFPQSSEKERVYEVQHQSDDFEVLNVASSCASRERDWRGNACIGGKYIPFKVDTGSQANVRPLSMFRKLKTTTLMPSSAVLRSYDGNTIKHIGKFSALIGIGGRKACAEFFVVKDHSTILGLDTSEKFRILQRAVESVTTNDTEEIVNEFPRLFHGTGCAPREYKIELHRDAVPVVQPAWRVPLSLREPLRTELDRMKKEGIIQKVSSRTDWVSPLVIVLKKDGKLASPVEDGPSPGELLQRRRLRTPLPDFNPVSATLVKKHRQRSHHRRTLPGLCDNDVVRLNRTPWAAKAKVIGSAGPRSFYVHTENNTVLGRNRRHLLATKEPYSVGSPDDEDFANNHIPFQGEASSTTAASPA